MSLLNAWRTRSGTPSSPCIQQAPRSGTITPVRQAEQAHTRVVPQQRTGNRVCGVPWVPACGCVESSYGFTMGSRASSKGRVGCTHHGPCIDPVRVLGVVIVDAVAHFFPASINGPVVPVKRQVDPAPAHVGVCVHQHCAAHPPCRAGALTTASRHAACNGGEWCAGAVDDAAGTAPLSSMQHAACSSTARRMAVGGWQRAANAARTRRSS